MLDRGSHHWDFTPRLTRVFYRCCSSLPQGKGVKCRGPISHPSWCDNQCDFNLFGDNHWSWKAVSIDYNTSQLSRWAVADGEFNGLLATRFFFQYWLQCSFVVVDNSTVICVVLPLISRLGMGILNIWPGWHIAEAQTVGLSSNPSSDYTQLYYWAIQLCFSGSRVQLIEHTGWTLSVCASTALVLYALLFLFQNFHPSNSFLRPWHVLSFVCAFLLMNLWTIFLVKSKCLRKKKNQGFAVNILQSCRLLLLRLPVCRRVTENKRIWCWKLW